jgi:TDG/mug DNA glycosylase family protein
VTAAGLPDILGPGLRVLFCGINPGLTSAATGHHFARPGNRFWPALHRSGFTPRQLAPAEQRELLRLGLGITNLAPRATARADELSREELVAGAAMLVEKVGLWLPSWLAVVGVTAYRTAFARPRATVGLQPHTIGTTRVWVLPNPSGLNARWTPATLAEQFARLREVSDAAAHPEEQPGHRGGDQGGAEQVHRDERDGQAGEVLHEADHALRQLDREQRPGGEHGSTGRADRQQRQE